MKYYLFVRDDSGRYSYYTAFNYSEDGPIPYRWAANGGYQFGNMNVTRRDTTSMAPVEFERYPNLEEGKSFFCLKTDAVTEDALNDRLSLIKEWATTDEFKTGIHLCELEAISSRLEMMQAN